MRITTCGLKNTIAKAARVAIRQALGQPASQLTVSQDTSRQSRDDDNSSRTEALRQRFAEKKAEADKNKERRPRPWRSEVFDIIKHSLTSTTLSMVRTVTSLRETRATASLSFFCLSRSIRLSDNFFKALVASYTCISYIASVAKQLFASFLHVPEAIPPGYPPGDGPIMNCYDKFATASTNTDLVNIAA
jgi:hypothetical protein